MEVSPPPPPLGGAVEGNNSLGGKEKEGEESENGPAGQCKHTHKHTLNLNTPMPVLDGLKTKFTKKLHCPLLTRGWSSTNLPFFFLGLFVLRICDVQSRANR